MNTLYINAIKNHKLIFSILKKFHLTDRMDDRKYLEKLYPVMTGEKLNLDSPTTYNEKLQWLKLYERDDRYTTFVDKYKVKEYVASTIGAEYVIPLLGVWESADEIDFDILPEQFVLKCTHDSCGLVICREKSSLDYEQVREKLQKCLKNNFFSVGREWPYKNVKPLIIAEKYMEDSNDRELRDYKFFTFNGIPRILYIAQGRGKGMPTVADFFDMQGNHIDLKIDHENAEECPHLPKNFELMKELSEKLAQGTSYLRVDFYEVDGQVYFGEMTFYHCGGFVPFKTKEWEKKLGSWISLPEIKSEK